MFGRKKAIAPQINFDKEKQKAVIRCSICTGEQVAGFKDIHTGKFTEVMLVKNEGEMRNFMERYHLGAVEKEY